MSDLKLISPLLDGFSVGNPMGEHDGVRCHPAIKETSEQKYILKVITIPATQKQMDALLLAGAYRDPADAMDYFKEIGDGVMQEAQLLQKLAKLEGFLSYEGWQMEPITSRRLGYEVYLIGSYKRSLDKYVRRNPVTHLEAINLGLDLCAALAACRQAGALYVDLKPTNIFLSEKKEYRIGDLGFLQLDALKYTALPARYCSRYTPPELHDPMEPVNLTADTYAVGMILYQLYNDGQLPFQDRAPQEALPSPINADYELAEILMKAIHPDPQQRWTDPKDMGHALVAYMQRNTVNDVPITPHTPLEVDPEDVVFFQRRAEGGVGPQQDAAPDAPLEDDPEAASPGSDTTPAPQEAAAPAAPEDGEAAPPQFPEDETAPGEADAESLLPHEMSDELSKIIAKADDLLTHDTPGGVVVPEVPEPPDPFAFATEDSEAAEDASVPLDPVMEDPPEVSQKGGTRKPGKRFASGAGKRRLKKVVSWLLLLLVLAGLAWGGYWAYQNVYLQSIDSLTVQAQKDQLTVTVDTSADASSLRVTCSDNYGNTLTQEVTNGQAVFTDLQPNTLYRIQVEIDGFHKLIGETSASYTTETTTRITSFTAVTGSEDGSVMLNFTVDGDEPESWTLIYKGEGEEAQSQTFTGHSISLSGLSLGRVYTFTLDAGEDLSLSGKYSLDFMASRLILAQDLTVTSTGSGDMTISWEAPGDVVVESWTVRCYSDSGYDEQLTVSDTQVSLTGIDSSVAYTVEVTAAGMTQPARASITANPVNVTALEVDDSQSDALRLTWRYSGSAPEGGWLLMYTIDGSDSQNVVKCDTASASISPRIPGAKYQFTLQSADATSIFNNVHDYTCPEGEAFSEYGINAEEVVLQLLKTPEEETWRFENVSSDAFTDTFSPGDSVSLVLSHADNFYLPGYEVEILYVIRDAYGNVLPEWTSQQTMVWKDIWYAGDYHYGELTLPKTPDSTGSYSLSVYVNGGMLASATFTIAE